MHFSIKCWTITKLSMSFTKILVLFSLLMLEKIVFAILMPDLIIEYIQKSKYIWFYCVLLYNTASEVTGSMYSWVSDSESVGDARDRKCLLLSKRQYHFADSNSLHQKDNRFYDLYLFTNINIKPKNQNLPFYFWTKECIFKQ